ncbi:uncharacterized protein CC84DRAFT_1159696 [Paraphaeosphaeria sporulosa]|uniref:L-ornithine N(5)-monooxygenase [NAD(P)H] n=1 Tax=Paraphaeosphaeria sporulosa TaxID=1460663 RepID=A0A177CZ05_9PLEO|nr:uncharacterized protein CC84DRAFT_1159696 [Paraphaeosphaeria sporulosa]OAG12371.1 hypothetical protein CC84DRAFT_1159696 [Paraphaeosphaeria sporulosa]
MTSTEQHSRPFNPISSSPQEMSTMVYDLLCIGFGPAQLATAIANHESRKPANLLFVERKANFSWHSPQLARTRMESPFIYDLVTTRNPRSAFSYTNYLFVRDRLVEFTNSDRLNPLRLEFEDYLGWAAGHFEDSIRYGSEVVGVAPEKGDGPVRRWNVAIRDANGQSQVVQARSIVGPSPSGKHDHKPLSLTNVDFLAGQRIISVEDYKLKRDTLRGKNEPRLNVAVVGSGEQTIEILADLLTCPRLGNITVVTENESLAPLRILEGEQEPPQPRLCSIWAKPSCEQKSTVTGSSELVQDIYARAYEKQVASKGEYTLRVVVGSRDAGGACSNAKVIIAEQPQRSTFANNGLFHGLDALVLGCRQKGDSLEEVQFKRGAVAESCKVWMLSAHSEGGRSLAKDIALRAGEVVNALATTEQGRERESMMIAARM